MSNGTGNRFISWVRGFQITFFIVAIVIALIPIYQYFMNTNVSIEFNKHYIFCYRNTDYGTVKVENDKNIGTSQGSYFDSITLNFALMNNNPLKNFFVNNAYLYISESKNDLDKLVKGAYIEPDRYLRYQAQYIIDKFRWEDVESYNENTSFFEVLGIPSNDVKVFNIEFYPVGWYNPEVGKDRYNFKGETNYYIVLYTEDINKNKTFLNKDNYLEIRIYQSAINYLESYYPMEKANIY